MDDNDKEEYSVFLLFYADTPNGELNKLFKWRLSSILDYPKRIEYFLRKGFRIRSAYIETNVFQNETKNMRISTAEIQSINDNIKR